MCFAQSAALLLRCYGATLLRCYAATLVRCCCAAALLRCCAPLLRCCACRCFSRSEAEVSGPEEVVPQRVRTLASNTLCRVRSITPLKPRSKRAMCLPKYTAEVQRIRASAPRATAEKSRGNTKYFSFFDSFLYVTLETDTEILLLLLLRPLLQRRERTARTSNTSRSSLTSPSRATPTYFSFLYYLFYFEVERERDVLLLPVRCTRERQRSTSITSITSFTST